MAEVPLIEMTFALPPALATAVAETFPVLDEAEAVALPFCLGTNEVVVLLFHAIDGNHIILCINI
jgi:hypothetical protein